MTRIVSAAWLAVALVWVLSRPVVPLEEQPWPDAATYVQLAEGLTHGEYRTELEGEREEPRYPPGMPMMLAPFTGLPPERVAQGFTVALIVAVWALARRLGGDVAGAVASVIVAASPALRAQSSFVMSDVMGALLTVVAAWCVVSGRDRLAGLLAGWITWTRLAGAVTVLGMRRRAWTPFAALLAALLAVKVITRFGYGSEEVGWSLRYVWDPDGIGGWPVPPDGNLIAYAKMLAGLGGGLTYPGVALLAVWGALRLPGGRWALIVSAGTFATYVAYYYQAPRFFFSVLALMAVYAGAAVGHLSDSAHPEPLARHLVHLSGAGGGVDVEPDVGGSGAQEGLRVDAGRDR